MRVEAKVCITVVATFLLLEVAARLFEPRLSKDVEEMLARRSLPEEIEKWNRAGGFTVLVIGNSLARANIDRNTMEEELAAKGISNPCVFFLTADGTNIIEWNASYRRYFSEEGSRPDWVILVSGPGHLLDQPPASPERLAAYHTAAKDVPRALTDWLPDANSRARFLFARISRLFACRERVRPILFYNWVPGFEETSESINRGGASSRKRGEVKNASTARFRETLESTSSPPQRVFVVTAALPFTYEIPAPVRSAAEELNVPILDYGADRNWEENAFPDGYHLSKEMSLLLTRETVAQLFLQ